MKKVFNLAEVFSPHCAGFQKAAFTLAEVLITLGIIGVVAALTLPTLIQNHKKQTLVNQLKKVVNTLENATQMAVAEEGVSSFKDTSFYCFVIAPYECSGYSSEERGNVLKKYLNLVSYGRWRKSYRETVDGIKLSGTEVVLTDASIIYINARVSAKSFFYIDINGEKGPNTTGRDIFTISLNEFGKVVGVVNDASRTLYCKDMISDSEYSDSEYLLEYGCYYTKIVSDGWKMNY